MLKKEWIIKSQGTEKHITELAESLSVSRIVASLLIQREVKTFEDAKKFFRPELEHLHDPFLMKDMDVAVKRIEQAVSNDEKMMIYGDYDVDGTTSVALMYSFLANYHSQIEYYIPDRYSEGYGISTHAIDLAANKGCRLIIALDCGIKAVEKVEYARQKGVEFIICDHHNPGKKIPKAIAVLDPKRKGCNYPFKDLSGCGVGFKLLQAYSSRNNIDFSELVPYLDLVAVSVASDIVPIIGENRVLTYFGLQELNKNPRIGLNAIIKIAGLKDKEISVDDIVFKIGPRINAAGRIESGRQAVDLLVSVDPSDASTIAGKINTFNQTRRDIDSTTTDDALNLIASNENLRKKKSTVLYNPEWHKGVIGIVASRLLESYYKPTVILTQSNGLATGSARSVYGYDLYQAIDSCSDLLENFGGHMYAAGLTMKIENIPEFSERFEKFVANTVSKENLIPVIEIDTEIQLEEITPKLVRILNQFEPFGPENMTPIFISENVYDSGAAKLVGNNREHLKLSIMNEQNPYKSFPAIAFGQAKFYEKVKTGEPFDICYSIFENTFNGRTEIQLRVRDLKFD